MDSSATLVIACRWAWCRLTFSDNGALVNHVVHEHVRRTTPVRRRDIPLLRRTEEGLGESLRLSDVMRDPSSSAAKSQGSQPSQQPPPSSSLPSPPASSPQGCTDLGAGEPPTSSASPSFGLVHRQRKRSPGPSEPRQKKRTRQRFLAQIAQNTLSPASSGSQRSVEGHLTQTDQDIDDSVGDGHGEPAELPGGLSSQPATSQEDGPVQHLETLSQPPSQLHLPSLPLNDRPSDLPPIQTEDSSLALPLSGPIVLSSAPDFAISTPQQQNWYQPSLQLKAPSRIGRSRLASTENTPNPSGQEVSAVPSIIEEEDPPHSQILSPQPRGKFPMAARPPPPQRQPSPLPESIRPVMTPLSKRTGFRSGTFQIERPPSTPVPHLHHQTPIKTVSYATDADDDTNKVTDTDMNDAIVDNSQSESDYRLEEFQLQSQAPYQSQLGYSQLD